MTTAPARATPLLIVSERTSEAVDGSALQRGARAGEYVSLRRGAYMLAAAWGDASETERYRARLDAVAATRQRGPIVFSHQSAALIWGIPVLGVWPREVHLLAVGRTAAHSKNGVIWHRDVFTDDEICEVDGLLVTSLMRTSVDLACTSGFASAVVALDHVLKPRLALPAGPVVAGLEKGDVFETLKRMASQRGVRKAEEAVTFADPLSGSPGETLSRVQIHVLRFPPPLLQVRVPRHDGYGDDFPDFTWRHHFGEFDGKGKYMREEYTHGRSPGDIVYDEKVREDRLRRTGRGFIRWDWNIALDRLRLRAHLIEAGLRPLSVSEYRRVSPLAAR